MRSKTALIALFLFLIAYISCDKTSTSPTQPFTLSFTDFQALTAPGKSLDMHFLDTTFTKFLNIGNTGESNVYDFSALNYLPGVTATFQSVMQIPHLASRYPSNGIALQMTDGSGNFNAPVMSLTNNQWLNHGDTQLQTDYQGIDERYSHRIPADIMLKFPANVGDQWASSYTQLDTIYSNGSMMQSASDSRTKSYFVDGRGTLKLPGGNQYSCLRILSFNDDTNPEGEIFYFTREGPFFHVTFDYASQTVGVVQIREAFYADISTTNSISITQTQFQSYFNSGHAFDIYVDTVYTELSSMNIGSTGGNNTYDFSGISHTLWGNMPLVQTSSVPRLASRYPNSFAFQFPQGPQNYNYPIFKYVGNEWLNLGEVNLYDASNYEYYSFLNPPQVMLQFPATYGDLWITNSMITDSVYSQSGNYGGYYPRNSSHYIDGWGILKLPGSIQANCIRVRSIELQGEGKTEIMYFTAEGYYVRVSMYNNEPASGIVYASDFMYGIPHTFPSKK